MKPWKRLRPVYAAGALLITLPLIGAGCKSGGETTASTPPAAEGQPSGQPSAGEPQPVAPAPDPQTVPIFFRQVNFAVKPKPVLSKQPDGKVIRFVEFKYRAQGDPEALAPFLLPPTKTSPEASSLWTVRMPVDATVGQKTPGEWENLFCTFVVPDMVAINRANKALQARLSAMRSQIYKRKVYKIDVLAGDRLPEEAKAQVGDALATATRDGYQRAVRFAALARDAEKRGDRQQARTYITAAYASIGDVAFDNGHDADAQWLYQEAPGLAQANVKAPKR